MVREIMHDPLFLAQKSEPATEMDKPIAIDLLDTLRAHLKHCVGMAANMIGETKNIIAVCKGNKQIILINPTIIQKSKPYPTEESCLSLPGIKKTIRYDVIEVEFQTIDFQKRKEKFTGWTAEIIQHEIDHCNGILI
ncbi:MAG: peptide deformylase [Paludibacteraceae bacterium]|nr:peptide deformylase [Paludibacteraceae bacterium]